MSPVVDLAFFVKAGKRSTATIHIQLGQAEEFANRQNTPLAAETSSDCLKLRASAAARPDWTCKVVGKASLRKRSCENDKCRKDVLMLKVFRGVTNFYGNNTVYVTDGEHAVQKLGSHNYEITSMKNDGDDLWVTSGVIVALGALCETSSAIRQLKAVLKKLSADLEAGKEVVNASPAQSQIRSQRINPSKKSIRRQKIDKIDSREPPIWTPRKSNRLW